MLSNGNDTNKNAQCTYCKADDDFWKKLPNYEKEMENDAKNGKSPNVRLTHNARPSGKQIT